MSSLSPHDGGLPYDVSVLSDAELRAYRAAYAPFDAANEGVMVVADIPMALRVLSLNVSDAELRTQIDLLAKGQPRISFITFCQLAERIKKAPSGPSAISTAEAAFAVFDAEGTGSVSVAVFREIFSKFSDQKIFDEEFIDALVLYADPEMTGSVRYGSLCQRLDADNRIAANALAAAKK